jgi:hypothetical protein
MQRNPVSQKQQQQKKFTGGKNMYNTGLAIFLIILYLKKKKKKKKKKGEEEEEGEEEKKRRKKRKKKLKFIAITVLTLGGDGTGLVSIPLLLYLRLSSGHTSLQERGGCSHCVPQTASHESHTNGIRKGVCKSTETATRFKVTVTGGHTPGLHPGLGLWNARPPISCPLNF